MVSSGGVDHSGGGGFTSTAVDLKRREIVKDALIQREASILRGPRELRGEKCARACSSSHLH